MKLNNPPPISPLHLNSETDEHTKLVLTIEARLTTLKQKAQQWCLYALPLIELQRDQYRQREKLSAQFIQLIKFLITGLLSFEDTHIFYDQLSVWKDQMMEQTFAQISPLAQEIRNIIGMLRNTVISYQGLLQNISRTNRSICVLPLIIDRDLLEQQLTKICEGFDQEMAKYLDDDKRVFHITLQSIQETQNTCIQIGQVMQLSLITEPPKITHPLSTPVSTMPTLSLPSTPETLTPSPPDAKYSRVLSPTQTQKKRKYYASSQPSVDPVESKTVMSLLKKNRVPDPTSNSAANLMIQRGMWQQVSPEINPPESDTSSPSAPLPAAYSLV
jgi:hypothetical protein